MAYKDHGWELTPLFWPRRSLSGHLIWFVGMRRRVMGHYQYRDLTDREVDRINDETAW